MYKQVHPSHSPRTLSLECEGGVALRILLLKEGKGLPQVLSDSTFSRYHLLLGGEYSRASVAGERADLTCCCVTWCMQEEISFEILACNAAPSLWICYWISSIVKWEIKREYFM